jgi:hypothetical protein
VNAAALNRLALSFSITGSSLAMFLVGFFGHQLPFAPVLTGSA